MAEQLSPIPDLDTVTMGLFWRCLGSTAGTYGWSSSGKLCMAKALRDLPSDWEQVPLEQLREQCYTEWVIMEFEKPLESVATSTLTSYTLKRTEDRMLQLSVTKHEMFETNDPDELLEDIRLMMQDVAAQEALGLDMPLVDDYLELARILRDV